MSEPSTPPQGDSAAKAVGTAGSDPVRADAVNTDAIPNAVNAEAVDSEAIAPTRADADVDVDTATKAPAPVEAESAPQAIDATTANPAAADAADPQPEAATVEPATEPAAAEQAAASSQEDMAHEYVDYYVPNPVDAENAAQGDNPQAPAADISAANTGAPAPSLTDDGALSPPPPPPPAGTGSPAAPYEDPSLVPSKTPPPASPAATTAPPEAKAMSLMDHLGELRSRLVRSAIAVALAFAATYSVADLIFAQLMRPLLAALPPNSKLIFTALPEAFFVYLQVGFVAAIFLASPYIFYQIWGFIAPGLYEEEKKFAVPMALFSAFFFILGSAFCFLVVFPFSFTFFVGFATDDIIPMPSLSEYLGFALKMLIAFGLIFEMPLFTFFLARMGMVNATMMRKVRRYAILVIFIVAAILTPPDVMSQMLMAIPMILLYEFSILIAVAFGKKPRSESDSTDSDDASSKATSDAKDGANVQAPQPAASTSTETTAP